MKMKFIIKGLLLIIFNCLLFILFISFNLGAAFWVDDFENEDFIQTKQYISYDCINDQIIMEMNTNINLAYQQTVAASSTQGSDPKYAADNAVDGRYSSTNENIVYYRWSAEGTAPQWFEITFDSSVPFNMIKIYWGNTAEAKSWKIKIFDGGSWKDVYTKTDNSDSVSLILFQEVEHAKKIKLANMTTNEGHYWGVSIKEIEVCNIFTLNDGFVDASSSQSGYPAADAFDGDLSTRWASAQENNEYILFSFNKKVILNNIQLKWEASGTKYRIDASNDRTKWTSAYSDTNFTGAYGTNVHIKLPPFMTRYIRMYGIEHGSRNQSDPVHGTEWGNFSLYEFMIHKTSILTNSGIIKSKPITPAGISQWQNVYYSVEIPGGTSITVFVCNTNGTELISDIADREINCIDISGIDKAVHPGLILKAILQTTSDDSPVLKQWSIHWSFTSDYLKINDFQINSQGFNVSEDMNNYNLLLGFNWSNLYLSSTLKYKIYRDLSTITETGIFSRGLFPLAELSKNSFSYLDTVDSADKVYYYSLVTVDTNNFYCLANNTISLLIDLSYNESWIWVPSNWIWVEGENPLQKDGGSTDDAKSAASGGFCLGDGWQGWAVYDTTIRNNMENAYLYMRYSTLNNPDCSIYMDNIEDGDSPLAIEKLDATSDWNEFVYKIINIGPLSAGIHRLKIDPDNGVNFDGFYLYDGIFTPDNTVDNKALDPPPAMRRLSVFIEKNVTLNDKQISDALKNPFIKNPNPVVGYKYSVEGRSKAYFDVPILIRLYFNSSDIPIGVNKDHLSVFYWDSMHWVKVGGKVCSLNDSYYLSTKVNHFSLFAVFEESGYGFDESVKWSYNPFSPNRDGVCDTTHLMFKLFKNGKVTVKIFNLKGRIVRTLLDRVMNAEDCISVEWDGRDEENRLVSTGIYVYQIVTDCLVQNKNVINGTIIVTK